MFFTSLCFYAQKGRQTSTILINSVDSSNDNNALDLDSVCNIESSMLKAIRSLL